MDEAHIIKNDTTERNTAFYDLTTAFHVVSTKSLVNFFKTFILQYCQTWPALPFTPSILPVKESCLERIWTWSAQDLRSS